jgi:hypothetical protein
MQPPWWPGRRLGPTGPDLALQPFTMSTTDSRNGPHGPFVTRVVQTLTSGHQLVSLSRRHRKRLPPLHVTLDGRRVHRGPPRSPRWSFEPRQVSWWVVILNLTGSVAFQVAAVYSFFPPPPETGWAWSANLWTMIGALCFFLASYLMIPELFDADATAPSKAVPAPAGG